MNAHPHRVVYIVVDGMNTDAFERATASRVLDAQDSIIPFLSTLRDPPLRPASVDVVPHIVGHFRRLRSP